MNVNLLFFARYRELLGKSCETLQLPLDIKTVSGLSEFLSSRGDNWHFIFTDPAIKCAINQTVANNNDELHEGDEIAFFPPVTGG